MLTASYRGLRRIEHVPEEWVLEVEQAVLETQAYLDAVKEVMAINLELLAQTRAEHVARKRTSRARSRQKSDKKRKKSINQKPIAADHQHTCCSNPAGHGPGVPALPEGDTPLVFARVGKASQLPVQAPTM